MNESELILITEKGYLESTSKLLIWTIRNFGGAYSDIPIFSYQPRKRYKISRETISFFEKNEVNYVDLELNKKYSYYPFANKTFSCAHREIHTSAETLIYIDSDTFFLKEPIDLADFDDCDVILRPVDYKIAGAENTFDKNAPYWEQLYKLLNVKDRRKVWSTGDHKEIYEYYNGGHIVTKTKNNLFKTWKENFIKTMKHNLKPDNGILYVEQTVFAATVSKLKLRVKQVDHYNFPVFFLTQCTNFREQVESFEKLITIHYHKIFKNKLGINPIYDLLESCKNGQIINRKLVEFRIIKKERTFITFIKRFKRRLRRLKMNAG